MFTPNLIDSLCVQILPIWLCTRHRVQYTIDVHIHAFMSVSSQVVAKPNDPVCFDLMLSFYALMCSVCN